MLVDTGSANLLVPATICTNCGGEDETFVSQRLDIEAAKAEYISCNDARCKVRGEFIY